MKRLLILGAKGGMGLQCVKRTLELGNVTAIACGRKASEHSELLALQASLPSNPADARLQLMDLDVTDSQSLEAAVGSCDAAIFCCSGNSAATYVAVNDEALGELGRACAVKRVPVVACSSQLVDPKNRWHPLRMLLNTIAWGKADAKFAGESKLRSAGAEYVIVRPGRLEDGELNRGSCSLGQNDGVGNYAPQNGSTRADVAHVLVTVALHAAMRTADAPLRLTMEMGCEQIPSGISDLVEVRKAILARLNEMSSD